MGLMGNPKILAALVGAGVLAPTDADAMYIGPKAKGWDRAIGKFTALFDKMPRAEISDKGVGVALDKMKGNEMRGWLPDYVNHPELFEQYPFLNNITVGFKQGIGNEGSFKPSAGYVSGRPWEGDITVGTGVYPWRDKTFAPKDMGLARETPKVKQTLIHEIQHAIQEKEGWARGGNLQTFERTGTDDVLIEGAKRRIATLKKTPEFKAWESEKMAVFDKDLNPQEMNIAFERIDAKYKPFVDEWYKINDFAYTKEKLTRDPVKSYRNLSGEVEARDTAARMGLSAEQRLSQPHYASQGIDLKDMITKMGGAAGLMSLYSPQAAQAQQYRNMAEQQSLQEPTFDPTTLLAGPARWGGGLMNMIGDTLFKGAGRVGINTESGI
jgi:hypothetical protein